MTASPQSTRDPQAQWLDAVVRRVVERLMAMQERRPEGQVAGATPAGTPQAATAERLTGEKTSGVSGPADELAADIVLDEPLVTLESLRGYQLENKVLLVNAGAVVTPAVKDELRTRQARLVRRPSATGSQSLARGRATRTGLPCLVQGNLSRLDPQLMGLAIDVVDANHHGWQQLRLELESYVAAQGQAILIALEPYVAVCELNRSALLRAGYAATATALGKLAQQLNPNVIVLDARRYTHATIREALAQLDRLKIAGQIVAGGKI